MSLKLVKKTLYCESLPIDHLTELNRNSLKNNYYLNKKITYLHISLFSLFDEACIKDRGIIVNLDIATFHPALNWDSI